MLQSAVTTSRIAVSLVMQRELLAPATGARLSCPHAPASWVIRPAIQPSIGGCEVIARFVCQIPVRHAAVVEDDLATWMAAEELLRLWRSHWGLPLVRPLGMSSRRLAAGGATGREGDCGTSAGTDRDPSAL